MSAIWCAGVCRLCVGSDGDLACGLDRAGVWVALERVRAGEDESCRRLPAETVAGLGSPATGLRCGLVVGIEGAEVEPELNELGEGDGAGLGGVAALEPFKDRPPRQIDAQRIGAERVQ